MTNSPIEISILVPAFNEAGGIRKTIEALRETFDQTRCRHEIIVIDDGSSDNTVEIAQACGAMVISHPENLGYGAALKTGIKRAQYKWVAITDADGTYPIGEFPNLLKHIPAFDMVVGSRTGTFYAGGWFKRAGRTFFKWLSEFATGRSIPDINSGMRVFRRDFVLEQFKHISTGFSFTTTLTLSMMLEGQFVKYVPISYSNRTGPSHVRYSRDTLRAAQIVVQAILWYNPVKVFLPLAVLAAAGSVFAGILAFWLSEYALPLLLCWAGFSLALLFMALGFLGYIVHAVGTEDR